MNNWDDKNYWEDTKTWLDNLLNSEPVMNKWVGYGVMFLLVASIVFLAIKK